MILTNEEIAKRRKSYEAAKHMEVKAPVSPDEALEYLDIIESRDTLIADLKSELFEVRRTSEQRVNDLLKSIDETLKLLRKFVERIS